MEQQFNVAATKLLNILESEQSKTKVEFPHLHQFPINCCEVSSFLFRYLLEEQIENTNVNVIKGESQDSTCHFWCEVHNLIYDLTAHQFPNINSPILGEVNTQPLNASQYSSHCVVQVSNLVSLEDYQSFKIQFEL